MARRAGVEDLDAAARVLGIAFADYPWTRWCVDADRHVERLTALQRLSLELLGLPFGEVWVVELDDEIAGVAVWSDSRVAVDRSVFLELSDRSRPWHGDRLAAAVEAETGSHERPRRDHRFLETTGVLPASRRAGLGTAVLTPVIEQASAEGLVCALETSTPDNVEFYRTLGFEAVDRRIVAGGGPDVWTMHRQP